MLELLLVVLVIKQNLVAHLPLKVLRLLSVAVLATIGMLTLTLLMVVPVVAQQNLLPLVPDF